MTTNNNNMDLFGNFGDVSQDDVKNLGGESKYPGLFLCQVKSAVLNSFDNGTKTIELTINVCDEETRSTVRSIKLDPMFLCGEGGERTDANNRNITKINNMRFLFNPQMPDKTLWNVGLAPAKVWDKEAKLFVEDKQVPQLLDLVGRYFWAILVSYKEFEKVYVNGYSRNPITPYSVDPIAHESERKEPDTIKVPDYSAKPKYRVAIWSFYSLDTKQSLAERIKGEEPKEITTSLADVEKKHDEKYFIEKELTDDKEASERKKILQRKLGKAFDEQKWESYNSKVNSVMNSVSNMF